MRQHPVASLTFLVAALLLPAAALGARPPVPVPPALAPGQVPGICTHEGADAYGPTMGYYWSEPTSAWAPAPRCYPRWGNLELSPSIVAAGGSTVTMTATPTEGSNTGEYLAEAGGASWSHPGTTVAGCGTHDLTCSFRVGRNTTEVWSWGQVHVSMPRTFFVDSPGSNCAGQHLCGGVSTQAWAFVGVKPRIAGHVIRGRVTEVDCGDGSCRVAGASGVTVRATGPKGSRSGTTDGSGNYAIEGLRTGTYDVAPTGTRRFEPRSRTLRVAADVRGVDFRTCALGRAMTCDDPDAIDWTMPSRMAKLYAKSGGVPLRSDVHATRWTVDLQAERRGKAARCSGERWEWDVTPPRGAKVLVAPKPGCRSRMVVSELGAYKVRLEKVESGEVTAKVPAKGPATVIARDWLIVGMGDSNASGEGNPPFENAQCNRSSASYQYRAASFVETNDPRSSVTFVHPACSGATTFNVWANGYAGIEPIRNVTMPTQLDQVAKVISGQPAVPGEHDRQRTVDAVILSIGVNDLGFGSIIQHCTQLGIVAALECQDLPTTVKEQKGFVTYASGRDGAPSLDTLLGQRQRALAAKYPPIARGLAAPATPTGGGLGLRRPARVFITQYPDFTQFGGGQTCSTVFSDLIRLETSTWGWLSASAAHLNANVARAAVANGWTLVPLPRDTFRDHGYCADDPWFASIEMSAYLGNIAGTLHPTVRAHEVAGDLVRAPMCRALYGNPGCSGKPKA